MIEHTAEKLRSIFEAQSTTDDLVFQGYDQEQWTRIQHYEEEAWLAVVQLWESYNLHLAHAIANIPEVTLNRPRLPHSLDKIAWQQVSAEEPTTLEYLIREYMGHLQDHLNQVFPTKG